MSTVPPRGINERQRGLLWMIGGILVLLYAFNLFAQSLNFLVILGGVAMITFGFNQLGGTEKIKKFLKRAQQ